jgi:hypothetical protein
MLWPEIKTWSWKFIVVPSLMGIFFGIGNFLAYLFFSYEGFRRAENKLNAVLSELI